MHRAEKLSDGLVNREQGWQTPPAPFMRGKLWDAFDAPKPVPMISVDHPRRGERILFPQYTFRVETSSSDAVEISIDGEGWRACRQAVGYWWYDWSDYQSGLHQVVVRLRPRDGETTPAQTCLFRVEMPLLGNAESTA